MYSFSRIFVCVKSRPARPDIASSHGVLELWNPFDVMNMTWGHRMNFYILCSDIPQHLPTFFIRPSSDGTYYGMVMSVRVSVRPSIHPSVRSPSARFPHFSPTCFDILSWNFAHDFVLMYYRSSLSVITLRQFLKELCLFVNLEYRKYTVFRTFLLLALTYWPEILHMTLFWCTTEQVRVSSLCVNFSRSYASFGT